MRRDDLERIKSVSPIVGAFFELVESEFHAVFTWTGSDSVGVDGSLSISDWEQLLSRTFAATKDLS